MKKLIIGEDLSRICPGIQLGCIQYTAQVEKGSKELWKEISQVSKSIASDTSLEGITSIANIAALRKAYKAIGKDPNRYRGSAEALIRRILQGKDLYRINNVVDANNLISIKTRLSVGSYDLDKLGNNLIFRVGNKGEKYKGIGKDIINTEYLPVFADEYGAYGSPTSDSEKAMITPDAKTILTVLISFSESDNLEEHMKYAKNILERYVGAKDIMMYISMANIKTKSDDFEGKI